MKKGFTLIELLVVVLIIGILAAIALPQYNMAVEKSRATEALIWMRAAADAEERFFLSTGSYTTDWESLDISAPISKKYEISLDNSTYNIRVKNKDGKAYHLRYFMENISQNSYPSRILCLHPVDDDTYKKLCLSLGGKNPHVYKHMSGTQMAYYLN
ncbi:PilE-like protein [Elusimicrobium minutum Pei191]|uniref:PilE-like protein n=1 Tax=Elusimicrobium minutum (strain Pei191) TaxID=445932 RepID=B2KC34_ELUMP|nr:PilE-like protein [Elusimicrobium minutum Pei191]